jgi:hypothetical protein
MTDASETGPAEKSDQKSADAPRGQARVRFDTTHLKSTYCNVCNGSSTREEVVINFGVNETWDMNRPELDVHLHHRIVMSPHAAKRLRDMMNRLIDEHETRYGALDPR